MKRPRFRLTRFERILWITSLAVVTLSFLCSPAPQWLTLIASLVGVTALIFVSRGDVLGQILTIVFSLLYAVISFRFRYYGEMITYVGMSAPGAAAAVIAWLRHPYGKRQVAVASLGKWDLLLGPLLTLSVTGIFYPILRALGTANLPFSTLSVATSFAAVYLTVRRSSFYALAYAANDCVLIVLWISASLTDPGYLPMILCFLMFLCNDLYGFFHWRRMQRAQSVPHLEDC